MFLYYLFQGADRRTKDALEAHNYWKRQMSIHRSWRRPARRGGQLAILAALAVLGACGGGNAPPNPAAVTNVAAASVEAGGPMTAFTPVAASNGTPPYAFAVSPALPAGVSMDKTSGAVTGTATTAQTASTYSVTVSDANSLSATSTFTLAVTPGVTATAAIATPSISAYTAATPFTPVVAGSGTAPYSYSVSPALPAGLSMSASTGAISGTTTIIQAQTAYTVTIQDAVKSVATGVFKLTTTTPVAAPLVTTVAAPSSTLTAGPAITPFAPITATGGFGSLTYVVTPNLPAGLSLNSATGVISGSPTAISAPTTYTETITDVLSTHQSGTFTLSVNPGPLTATTVIANVPASANAAITPAVPVVAAGGVAPYTYSIAVGTNTTATGTISGPALSFTGLSFDTTSGTLSGSTAVLLGSTPYIVTVTDSNASTSTGTFQLTTLPAGYIQYNGQTFMKPDPVTLYNHDGALALCAGTINGTTGWHLPSVAELQALWNAASAMGGSNTYIKDLGWTVSSAYYWASDAGTGTSFGRVSFGTGSTSTIAKTNSFYVTCAK